MRTYPNTTWKWVGEFVNDEKIERVPSGMVFSEWKWISIKLNWIGAG